MSILVLILFSIGAFLLWKFEVWSKTARILICLFFGVLVFGNMIQPYSNNIAQEGLYKKEGNVVMSYIFLIPELDKKSRRGSHGRVLYGPSYNKNTSSIIRGSYFLAKDNLITFEWESHKGPEAGIYKKNEIIIPCSVKGDAVYKFVKE